MATQTFNFTSSVIWAFTGSGAAGGSATSSITASFTCYGAGGHGSRTGNGGSGGAYAESGDVNAGIILRSGSLIHVHVGQATAADGGTSSVASASSVPFCRAAGGKMDGTVDHQYAINTGSICKAVGGLGGENFTGYGSYAGGGGGGCAGQNGAGVARAGGDGYSGFYATRKEPAAGGYYGNPSLIRPGGAGAFYDADVHNRIVSAGTGSVIGGGGGGGYDYPAGTDSSAAGGRGYVTITLHG